MNELVTQAWAETVMRLVAIGAPAAGIVLGAIIGRIRRQVIGGMVVGLIVGLCGTAIYGLWRMYTAMGNGLGYTSVVNIGIQLVVFTLVGVAMGFALQKALGTTCRRRPAGDRTRSTEEERLNAS